MTHIIGRNQNLETEGSTPTTVALNATTTTKLLDANILRIVYRVVNNSSQDVWIKEQAASVDNTVIGNILLPKKSYYETIPDNLYVGELSAIAVSGTPSVVVSEL